jgi:hypothetical protein
MKKFMQYLAEMRHNYLYNVKLAFKPDNDIMQKIEDALQKYSLVNISAPRSLPIQRVDKSFPGINSPETYMFSVEVEYPANADTIRHTIALIGMDLQQVAVTSTLHDASTEKEENEISQNTSEKALLLTPYKDQDNGKIAKDNYGSEYNDKLIKNSITHGKMIPDSLKEKKGKTSNDYPQGTKSAVGSTVNKKPEITSFSR